MPTHFAEKCKHGKVGAQCRCPGPKSVVTVKCSEVNCIEGSQRLTETEVRALAYEQIFNSAESVLEDWLDEDGEYSHKDYQRIFDKSFELLNELRERYL
jgi:hypothetical protein